MTLQIECSDLVKIFSAEGVEVQALQGLTLRVERGELTAIVGASGSGKSTLLAILTGLEVPTAGRATVAGHDLLAMSAAQRTRYRRDTVGFVWQQTSRNLLPYYTARQNTAMPLALAGMPRAKRAERVEHLVELLDMGDFAGRRPAQLSGGQQQRVAIAVALANEPEVLFADEPTGELDDINSQLVFDALGAVNRELGVTVLIVTHDEEVSSKVRRTVQIRDGRLSTEVHRSTETDEFGEERHRSQEFVVLDRVGRLQLPQEYVRSLGLSGLVRVELAEDHAQVHPTDRSKEADR
ncbi:ABC-type lipoprotein export system ATPase subunit [Leifsonia sp. AK011]|uniref:ABC transporter ATP-binding protein n=1 Tax=Leifsonia sp. AK011 TaxID=2723075 RepID=UPI0015C8B5C9|nr:ABC transporter ATP-binding protein [Leifsonia sp. AK011]NYF09021.1 ABC-type lipoprotein export system ATPase subunit [Leifsonia sp. AK011]